jgi:uncharacterized protein (TIGR04222 family)
MRSFNGYDEFYWDGPGFAHPWIRELQITATVPGGAQSATYFVGPPRSTTPCQTKKFTKGGQASFTQSKVAPGQSVSVGVKITPGLVADNKPHMGANGARLLTQRVSVITLAAVTVLTAVGSPIAGMLWWRKNGRDQRYADLAPGTVPLPGQKVRVVPNDSDVPIPVAFSPPPIPVAEAGLLIDGQVDYQETAATIIDLAVRGALTVQSTDEHDFRITLIDPSKASAPHEIVLLTTLFDGELQPGAERDLSQPGSIANAHEQMQDSVCNQVAGLGWFRNVPSAAGTRIFTLAVVTVALFATLGVGFWIAWARAVPRVLLLLLPLLPIIITVAVILAKLKRGQRTAGGRAM